MQDLCEEYLSCRRTESQGSYECANVLVSVAAKGRSVELKSLAINPARPSQMALAASDCFVRVYDRRMMGLASPAAAAGAPPSPALQLAPPHLTIGAPPHGDVHMTLKLTRTLTS